MITPTIEDRFADALNRLLGDERPNGIALAVSGGGDSVAMLHLAHAWSRTSGVGLWAVTVDHGLRPESASEARMVAEICTALDVPHATLRWHWNGAGNVQDAARKARLDLVNRWRGGLGHVLFAHTLDDQAETFLMRLRRGSGVEGLSAMQARRQVVFPDGQTMPLAADLDMSHPPPNGTRDNGFALLRPCLGITRDELRTYNRRIGAHWVDDPSNDDPAYERVRMRALMATLAEQGLDASCLAGTAARMARAQEALRRRASEAARALGSEEDTPHRRAGQVVLDRDRFAEWDRETRMRLLAGALQYVSGAVYRPRESALSTLLEQVESGKGGVLHGAEVAVTGAHILVLRELAAVAALEVPSGDWWDGQWRLALAGYPGLTIRALGEAGWRSLKNKDNLPIRHRFARALPALWDRGAPVACPALEYGPEVQIEHRVLGRVDAGFAAFLLSH